MEDSKALSSVDIESKGSAKIRNPLAEIPIETLLQNVVDFAVEKGLVEHTAILRQGALVARDPENYERIFGEDALSGEQKDALLHEATHKWSHPWSLYFTIITCSIGACVQGWDQTGSNGANLSFPKEFGIDDETIHDTLLVGAVNAGPYIGSALLGCWVSDPLNRIFGRRGCIFVSAIFCLFPVVFSGFSQTWLQLLVCRLLLGIGMGCKGSTVPIFAAENSPAAIRGALVMSWQLWTAFGIMLGTAANLAIAPIEHVAWRYQLGAAAIPAVPLLLMIYFCPESPRWYMKKNKYQKAYNSLLRLRYTTLQAARDLYYIHIQLEIERSLELEKQKQGASRVFGFITRFVELFTIPRVRRASLASFTVMIGQQMCGINIIAFYSSTIFVEAGFTPKQALLASFGFGVINFVFAFPAIFTIDTFGRRALLLFTFPNMAWTLLAAGLCNDFIGDMKTKLALVAFFVYVFAMFYSPGEGPVPFAYSAEVFPLSHREVGMGFAVATCLFWAAVLTIFLPLMLKALGVLGVFLLYAGMNILALFMIFLFVPETKQRTLEELDYVFGISTRAHMKYQTTKALPYFFRRWVLQNKDATLEPLYTFDSVEPARETSVIGTEKMSSREPQWEEQELR